ncbi:MAG TPA: ATP synthase F0 subunit B [Dongiaceae bacterium]|nr:ATP synthase F0 subunit B [Dongiaceae bacterium]
MSGSTGLNLAALRQSFTRAGARIAESLVLKPMTRRGFITGGGGAMMALSLPPPSKHRPSFAGLPFEVRKSSTRIALVRDEEERFVIDSTWFAPCAGSVAPPLLSAQWNNEGLSVRLSEAAFPGTVLRADLALTVRRRADVWVVELEFPGLHLSLAAPLDGWLNGTVAAYGRLRRSFYAFSAPPPQLHVAAGAKSEFWRTGALTFSGAPARLIVPEGVDRLIRRLQMELVPEAEHLVLPINGPRTIFTLERENRKWGWLAPPPALSHAALQLTEEPFDAIRLEAATIGTEPAIAALAFARRSISTARLKFDASANLAPLLMGQSILLGDVRQALRFASGRTETAATMAAVAGNQSLQAGLLQIDLDNPLQGPALEIRAVSGQKDGVTFAPALDAVRLPLGDEIVQSSRIPKHSRIEVLIDLDSCPRDDSDIVLDNKPAGSPPVQLKKLSTVLLRPQDFLLLQIDFIGFEYQEEQAQPFLRVMRDVEQAYLTVQFPPQHIAERSVEPGEEVGGNAKNHVPLPFASLFSKNSRLVFKVPAHYKTKPFPLTVARLLDWSDLQLSVSPRALPDMTGKHEEVRDLVDAPPLPGHWDRSPIVPGAAMSPLVENETKLEIPYGLYLSPHQWAQWHHATVPAAGAPEAHAGRTVTWTELWHTRLGYFNADGIDEDGRLVSRQELSVHPDPKHRFRDPRTDLRTLRAVYSEHYEDARDKSCVSALFPLLPSRNDSRDIVNFSSNYGLRYDVSESGTGGKVVPYLPSAIPYSHLMLSALGANLRLKGEWDPTRIKKADGCPQDSAIDRWIQDTVWARDQFVLISKKGYALPTGHYISFVTVHRREFVPDKDTGGVVAALRTRYYCEVKEPTLTYRYPADGPDTTLPPAGRRWPIQSITLSPSRTPFLKVPVDWLSGLPERENPAAFWMIPEDDQGSVTSFGANPPCDIDGLNAKPFEFTLTIKDLQNRVHECKLALPWVHRYLAENAETAKGWLVSGCDLMAEMLPAQSAIESILKDYLQLTAKPAAACDPANIHWERRRTTGFAAQKLAFAPKALGRDQAKDTAFETSEITLSFETNKMVDLHNDGGLQAEMPDYWPLKFYPVIDEARIRLGAVTTIAATAAASGATVAFSDIYRRVGFYVPANIVDDKFNKGEIYLDVADGDTKLNYPGDKSASVATPSFAVSQVSRLLGPTGGAKGSPVKALKGAIKTTSSVALGKFDAGEIFKNLPESTLLGAVGFGEVIATVEDIAEEIDKAIQVVEEKYNDVVKVYNEIDALRQQVDTIIGFVKEFPSYAKRVADELRTAAKHDIDAIAAEMMEQARQTIEQQIEVALNTVINKLLDSLAKALDPWLKGLSPADLAAILTLYNRDIEKLRSILDFGHVETSLKNAYADLQTQIAALKQFPFRRLRGVETRLQKLPALFNVKNPAGSLDQLNIELHAVENELQAIVQGTLDDLSKTEMQALKNVTDAITQLNMKFLDATSLVASIYADLKEYLNRPLALTVTANPRDDYDHRFKTWLQGEVNHFADDVVAPIQNTILHIEPPPVLVEAQTALNDLVANAAKIYQTFLATYLPIVFANIGPVVKVIEQVTAQIEEVLGELPTEVRVHFTWMPALQNAGAFIANFNREDAKLKVMVEASKSILKPDAPPTIEVVADLRNFQVELLPSAKFFIVGFNKIVFLSKNGAKPNVDVQISDVRLGEELAFIEQLGSIFSPGSGFYLGITPAGVEAGYRYEFPALFAGGFNIVQLALEAGVRLSFTGAPVRSWFAVSSRERPACMFSGIYGGCCFFGIDVDPTGVRKLEASFEFGAISFMSIGVASGMAYATGGVYFKTADGVAQLSGFFHCGGSFDIAGLVTLSLEFYLGFTYRRANGQSTAVGECELTVEIEYGFFDVSYKLHQQKVLQGSGGNSSEQDGEPERLTAEAMIGQPAIAAPPAATDARRKPKTPPTASLKEEWDTYRAAFAF